jgi:hypothetical protein
MNALLLASLLAFSAILAITFAVVLLTLFCMFIGCIILWTLNTVDAIAFRVRNGYWRASSIRR